MGRALASLVDRPEAAARLRRRGPLSRRQESAPSRLERVELPYYLVVLEVKRRSGARARPCFLVDAMSGDAVRLEPQAQEWTGADTTSVPPRLGPAAAASEARRLAERSRLLLRAGRGLRLGRTLDVELVYYPYWVLVYERRAGKLDVRVLDAVSGRAAGSGVRRSVLAAFVDQAGRAASEEAAS